MRPRLIKTNATAWKNKNNGEANKNKKEEQNTHERARRQPDTQSIAVKFSMVERSECANMSPTMVVGLYLHYRTKMAAEHHTAKTCVVRSHSL
jgi:hypothetical protein